MGRRWLAGSAAVLVVVLSRLAHLDLLWVEEAYGMVAARELLRGRSLYHDIWFDKPPVYAWFYLLCGAEPGLGLRIVGAAFVLWCGWCAWFTARALWSENEGLIAGALVCCGLTFWIPSAVMSVTPDMLFLPPFFLAIWASATSRPLLGGVFSGVALLCNSKGLAVLAVAACWAGAAWWKVVISCAIVQVGSFALLPAAPYWNQVWLWGAGYSADTFVVNPIREAMVRSSGWVAFHLTVCAGTVWCLWRERNWRFILWLVVSFACVVGGLRFFPRYYFALLPIFGVVGARGLMLMSVRWRILVFGLILVPILRFGPRYVMVAASGAAGWSDAALMRDSWQAAAVVRAWAHPTDKILVWGYRPDIVVWSGLPLATPYIDSQPLSGILADRHLTVSTPTFPALAADNLRALLLSPAPEILVDGLGRLNPTLSLENRQDLRSLLVRYERIGETSASIVYRLKP